MPHEVNSKALTEKYLKDIEENYRTEYLNEIAKHSHLLVYDWSKGGDLEVVVEDIENLDFRKKEFGDDRLEDWDWKPPHDRELIKRYTLAAHRIILDAHVPRLDVPELLVNAQDSAEWYNVYKSV